MWGEIEERVEKQEATESNISTQSTDSEQLNLVLSRGVESSIIPVCCYQPVRLDKEVKTLQDAETSFAHLNIEGSSSLGRMIETIAASGSPVKSQQLGEPDLTLEEKKEALMDQYLMKPLVFLERYQAHLKPEHLEVFSHLSGDCRAQHYCREIQRRASGTVERRRVRNQRYAALRALQKDGQYFSEEQMRVRDPLLYEQYIGQYLNEDEILQRSEEAMRSRPGGLADLLINSYQEKLIQKRLEEEQEREQCAEEESEEEESAEQEQAEWEPTSEEKAMLREEFLSQMHQRFLDGKDDFNYSEVDENPDYDNLDIMSRDAEERYFDGDDDEEEEHME